MFYNTDEVGAWARDFSYDEYLTLKKISDQQSKPISEEFYINLCKLLDKEMDKELND